MKGIDNLLSSDGRSEVVIDMGELISYRKEGHELIHQKGNLGWRNSDTEMFPLIGPTEKNDFIVNTDRGDAVQDQHGLLRELIYKKAGSTSNTIDFLKSYKKNSQVRNSKYPEKSTKEHVFWPYSFDFKKIYHLSNEALSIKFEIEGEKGMPFMLGYHPAFKLSGDCTESFQINKEEIDLQDILDAGSVAYPILDTNEIILLKKDGVQVSIQTKGFDNFMLWTEVANMVCIEPITAYPYSSEQALDVSLFKFWDTLAQFEIVIRPSFI